MTHSEAPPAWAMEKAREVVSRFMISSYYSEYKSTVSIARALAEADRAATERERERCARIADAKWASLLESADKAFESDNAQHAASAVGLNARADDMKSLAAAIRGAGHE